MTLTTLAAVTDLSNPMDSPFIVPVAGCVMILGIVVAGIWSGVRTREMQSQERLAAIAKGIPIPLTPAEIVLTQGRPQLADNTRRRGNVRRGGLICVGIGAGLIAFFLMLAAILQVRPVLAGAAVGLIPLGIGVALLIDARIQSREMEDAMQQPLATGRDLSL